MHQLTEKQLHLLEFLVSIHDWEMAECKPLHTQSGRSLYFELAKTVLKDETNQAGGLKRSLGRLSERTVRNRMRSFESKGFLEVRSRSTDGRTRQLVATDKFLEVLDHHLEECLVRLENHYFLIEKH